MSSIKTRLEALQEYRSSTSTEETLFIVEGGSEFKTPLDPWDYLLKYGAYTPEGKRIVRYPHPVDGLDPLSLSLYQLIDEAVKQGRLDLGDLKSDKI